MPGIIIPPFIGAPEEAPASSSGLLVYDELWVREPRLMVPQGRPVGNVLVSIPGPVYFATLFDSKIGHGLKWTTTLLDGSYTNGGWAPATYASELYLDETYQLLTAPFTALIQIKTPVSRGEYEYLFGSNYPNGLGLFARHALTSVKWGILVGASSFYAFPSSFELSGDTIYTIGVSKQGDGTTFLGAINGSYSGSLSCASTSLTTISFNSYTRGSPYGFNSGGLYLSTVWLARSVCEAELTDLTRDSALWWRPA